MSAEITAEKFVHGPGLRAENVHAEVTQFWQPVLASVATVQYLTLVRLFPLD